MSWYVAEDRSKSVREVVIDVARPSPLEPKFGMMMLGSKYSLLRSNVWVAGYFRMDGDPGPYLMVRADGYTATLRNKPLRVAHCFYRMRAGGLYAIYVDFPTLKLAGVPSGPFVLFEMIRGIDVAEERQRILDGIKSDKLRICFAEGNGGGRDLGDGMWSGSPINAQYDVILDIPTDCRSALTAEWEGLLKYHRSLSASVRDFGDSIEQMQSENPLSINPIVPPASRSGSSDSLRSGRKMNAETVSQGPSAAGASERIAEQQRRDSEAEPVALFDEPTRRRWWRFWR